MAKLFADARYEHFNRVGITVEILIINMLDQLGPRNNLALVVHQVGQQFIFLRGQLHGLPTQRDAARASIKANLANGKLRRSIARCAADQRPKARDQLFGLEWLCQIIIGTRVKTSHLVGPAVTRRQHQNREFAAFLAPAIKNRQAVNFGQAKVKNDRIIIFGRAHIMAVFAVGGQINRIASTFKGGLQLLAQCGFVFDDQDAHAVPFKW